MRRRLAFDTIDKAASRFCVASICSEISGVTLCPSGNSTIHFQSVSFPTASHKTEASQGVRRLKSTPDAGASGRDCVHVHDIPRCLVCIRIVRTTAAWVFLCSAGIAGVAGILCSTRIARITRLSRARIAGIASILCRTRIAWVTRLGRARVARPTALKRGFLRLGIRHQRCG